jgi:transglutaminase-like putative cysteine protease
VAIDARKVGPLTDAHRALFSDALRVDEEHMKVTPLIRKTAAAVCGTETNPALAVRKLLDHVADTADHYSKDPTKPRCGIGDAEDCMQNGGGCCTDLHSLFIALSRAQGVPARLQMGYRLLRRNLGKEVDPGYRCWVEYFLPGYGWISTDIVEADASGGLGRDRWFAGLTDERLWLNQGRGMTLAPKTANRVNHMSIAYAEIDGVPARILPDGDLKPQISRTIVFREVTEGGAPVNNAGGAR